MKILLASPERDLLECYKALFEADLGQTVTAFDGAQVLSLLKTEEFEIAVLDSELPRVGYGKLVTVTKDRKIPVIALINEPESVRRCRNEPQADAYLSYPFNYAEIKSVITKTLENTGKGSGAADENE